MNAIFLIITLLTFFTSNNNCQKLKDGIYLAKHTSKNGAVDYRLTISGERYNMQVNDTMNVIGKVKWIDNCSLKLEPEVHTKQDTTEVAKKLIQSFGEPFIKIRSSKGDKTYFRTMWTGTLHITINEGYFVRVK